MSVQNQDDGRAHLIRSRVERLARGRIRDLDVFCEGSRVILTGRSRTQYAKQLAQEAALDLPGDRPTLANRIEVG